MKQKRVILPFLANPALTPIKVAFSEIEGFFYVIFYFIPLGLSVVCHSKKRMLTKT